MLLPVLGFQVRVTVCGTEDGVEAVVAEPDRLMESVVPMELVSLSEPELLPAAEG